MKSSELQRIQVCAFALAVFACVLALTDASLASRPRRDGQGGPATPSALEARIERVENGLLPPAKIKGEATKGMKLPDRMQFYKAPAVSIAVINDGRFEWARAYGTLEAGGKVPARVTTIFQAASLSKPVTAMAALSLVQQGKLDLDTDVNGRLKSWQVPESEFTKTQKVTLRRILSHSAGLTVPGFLGYASDAQLPTLIQILNGTPPANSQPVRVEMIPGTKFRYAGGGYVVLQQLLTDVSGKSFPDLLDQFVLKKLGMDQAVF